MGLTIYCEKSREVIDVTMSGFFRLRMKVAELAGKEWGAHYAKLANAPLFGSARTDFFNAFDDKTDDLLAQGAVSVNIANFCLQSDCGGHVGPRTCKEILDVIGDYDDDLPYGYTGRADCATFSDFKRLLGECVKNKCDLVWD